MEGRMVRRQGYQGVKGNGCSSSSRGSQEPEAEGLAGDKAIAIYRTSKQA